MHHITWKKIKFSNFWCNDISWITTNDLNFVAIAEAGKLVGFNVLVGGGLAMTHGDTTTYPRCADGLGLFFQGKYSIVERSLLAVATKEPTEALQEFGFALNEVTINRKNTTSMLSIHTKLNDQFLTTYWSDGLIIATPTGSTGYSLSSGGPIVTPTSKCLVVNPIAPHNINMRPLIVPDDTAFEINVQGRGNTHLLSLDSRILTLENGNDIYIKKAEFSALTVQLDGTFFFNTLREKLFWGHDSRNVQ